ncbi:MAG TPA: hypothetical protein VF297_05850 [Pyrinomonadaceae bacterium]
MKRCLTVSLFVLLAAGVVRGQTPRLGREFKVKAGRVVTLDGGKLRLEFARVAEDSRCPVDVDCVWAGNAAVLIEVGGKGWRGKRTLTLNTNTGEAEAGYGRYMVRLKALSPQPRSNRKLSQGQYTATLLVTKD